MRCVILFLLVELDEDMMRLAVAKQQCQV